MKISSCYPLYAANDFSRFMDYMTIQQGYKILHRNAFGAHKLFTIESESGYRMDVAYLYGATEGIYATRINVDDFQEALDTFTSQGYKVEEPLYENPEMRLVFLTKEGTGRICLVEHIHAD